jgi:hypothetical protein
MISLLAFSKHMPSAHEATSGRRTTTLLVVPKTCRSRICVLCGIAESTDLGSGPDLERRVEEVCYSICLLVTAHPYQGICWTMLSPTASTMVLVESRYSTSFEVLISSSQPFQSCAWIGKLICQTRRATQLCMLSNGIGLSWTKVSINKDVHKILIDS